MLAAALLVAGCAGNPFASDTDLLLGAVGACKRSPAVQINDTRDAVEATDVNTDAELSALGCVVEYLGTPDEVIRQFTLSHANDPVYVTRTHTVSDDHYTYEWVHQRDTGLSMTIRAKKPD